MKISRIILAASLVLAPLSHALPASALDSALIKSESSSSVYYLYQGKRYVFPNEKVFFTWFSDFSNVITVSDAELASYPLARNLTYKPGTRMVKITTDPKVYAVERYGVLRWVTTEAIATNLYGANWNQKIHDVPDAFFTNYTMGEPLTASIQFYAALETSLANINAGVTWTPTAPPTSPSPTPTPAPTPTPTPEPTPTPTPTPEPTPTPTPEPTPTPTPTPTPEPEPTPTPVPANTYEVGTGKAYATLGAVPWSSLAPGSTVNVYWKAEPYREVIGISVRGTASQHIRVVGIPGPSGQKPIIDGQNAVMGPNVSYAYPGSGSTAGTPNRGVVVITPPQGYQWGFKPGYIDIEGLEIRNAHQPYTFTDNNGASRAFAKNAAAIFIERGEHITIKNCTITGSGNGIFVASADSEEVVSRDILVDGNSIYGNGNVGSDREHNVYTEAIGMVYQNNHFGTLMAGAGGANLKDRSAGTVIRYNWFDQAARLLDLVDAQESREMSTIDPSYQNTYVYGNILVNGPGGATRPIHFGGDDGETAFYRKNLYFHNNTFINISNQSGTNSRWRTSIFQAETPGETIYAKNNIFLNLPETAGATPTELSLMHLSGNLQLAGNWITSGWMDWNTNGQPITGTISGTNTFTTNVANDPGFVNFSTGEYHLKSGASAANIGVSLDAGAAGHASTRQYVKHSASQTRPVNGTIDAGAYEL